MKTSDDETAGPAPAAREARVALRRRAFLVLAMGTAACRSLWRRSSGEPTPEPAPMPPVKQAEEEVVVAAWAEPKALPEGGGIAQILVRLQKRGGKPYPGVEVRLRASRGTLYSQDRILVTDARGMTRDRLTTHNSSKITLNAGGTRYAFEVLVAPDTAAR